MPEFTIGDTVTTTMAVAPKGDIGFGPFRANARGPEMYMVMREDGTAVAVKASCIRALPAFTVGDEVEENASRRAGTVVAGPFRGISGKDRYVVEQKDGTHFWTAEGALRKRQATTDPDRSYTHAGKTYNLGAEYTDRQGDLWRFNGDRDADGMPLMGCPLYQTFRDYRLSSVVNEYGPLTRV